MKKGYIVSAIAIVAVISISIMFGCSRSKTIETDEGKVTFSEKGGTFKIETEKGTISMTGDTMKVKSDEGETEVIYGAGKIPDNFPKEIPVYQPSEVTMSNVLNDGKNAMVSLSTKDNLSKVKGFYEERLGKGGWSVNRSIKMGPMTLISSTNGKKHLNVTLNREGDKTLISLVFEGK